jgi:uncharacterized small protein (DUF1192 family)
MPGFSGVPLAGLSYVAHPRGEGGIIFLSSKKPIHGYLDHLRENLEILDEQIVNARKMSKPKGKADKAAALQWAKTVRDLVELRNQTLDRVKGALLGRDESGAATEAPDFYGGENPQIMFERDFQRLLAPWTREDLKLECEDCGKESEDVSTREFPHEYEDSEYFDLCTGCYEKRSVKKEESEEADDSESDESEEDSEASDPASILQGESGTVTMTEAVTALVQNTISAVTLDAHSPLEKVKELEEFKAHLIRSAYSHASAANIEHGVVLLNKEIERLRAEAGKDAAGKAVE